MCLFIFPYINCLPTSDIGTHFNDSVVLISSARVVYMLKSQQTQVWAKCSHINWPYARRTYIYSQFNAVSCLCVNHAQYTPCVFYCLTGI